MTNQQAPTESIHEGWTIATYAIHNEALRVADSRLHEERDRRYAEVALEREKALKIRENADLQALQLARDIQTYKDEKANELREQINRERVLYASKDDLQAAIRELQAVVAPLVNYVATQQGKNAGIGLMIGGAAVAIGIMLGILGFVITG